MVVTILPTEKKSASLGKAEEGKSGKLTMNQSSNTRSISDVVQVQLQESLLTLLYLWVGVVYRTLIIAPTYFQTFFHVSPTLSQLIYTSYFYLFSYFYLITRSKGFV